MVEFALAAPVLLMLLIGVIELGWGIYTYHFLASAAGRAARYAMVRGADCASFGSACPASASDIENYVRSLAPGAIDTSALTATTTWSPNNAPGGDVTVTVNYNFALNIPFVSTVAVPMSSSSEMVIAQ